jgi:hypothetical protein
VVLPQKANCDAKATGAILKSFISFMITWEINPSSFKCVLIEWCNFHRSKLYIIEPDRQFKRYFSLLPKVWYAASLTYTFFYSSLHPLFFLVKTRITYTQNSSVGLS